MLRDLLDTLIEGSRRAARLQFEGRSTARGPVPGWLEAVAAFDFTHVSEGSTRIEFSAPALGEVARDVHRQEDFFRPLHDDMSALQLFEAGLRDAIAGDLDSELFDAGLLATYAKLGKVLAHGFDELAFGDGGGVVVNAGAIDRVKDLGTRVPQPRHTRVAGKLEQTPDTGLAAIIGRWPGDETDEEIAAALEGIA